MILYGNGKKIANINEIIAPVIKMKKDARDTLIPPIFINLVSLADEFIITLMKYKK
jgi:hypothetical protein